MEPIQEAVGLPAHLESYLGPIQGGWGRDSDGSTASVQVAWFADAPFPRTVSFVTLGLSHHSLSSNESTSVHQELVFACHERFRSWSIPSLLKQLAGEALASHRAYLRGECVGPRGSLFESTTLEAVYFAMPVYFPEAFWTFRPPERQAIAMSWVVPLTASEADFVRTEGWPAFEEVLEQRDPDVLDLERSAIV